MRASLACTPLLSQDGERNARSRRGPYRNGQNKFEGIRGIWRSADVEYRDLWLDHLKIASVHCSKMASHFAKQRSARVYAFNRLPPNKDQTPPTETNASTQTLIPSHTTRSSLHDCFSHDCLTASGGSTLQVLITDEQSKSKSTYTRILSSTNNPFLRHLYLNQWRY